MANKTKRNWTVAALFLAPSIIAFLIFKYYPLLEAVRMAFFDYDVLNPPGAFVGLQNFIDALASTQFQNAFKNTLILFLLYMGLGFWVPAVQAVLLNVIRGRGRGIFQYLYLMAMSLPMIAGYVIWKWIWHPDYGLANAILRRFGMGPLGWLTDPGMVKLTLRLPLLLGGGFAIMYYLAAIENTPKDVYEAAIMDGASLWQQCWWITIPTMWPVVIINFIMALANSLLVFNDVLVMTQGGPAGASETLVLGLYNRAFGPAQLMGEGSAWAVLIALVTLVITSIQLWYSTRSESV